MDNSYFLNLNIYNLFLNNSNATESPDNYDYPYSDLFIKIVGQLIPKGYYTKKQEMQVMKFENLQGFKFVLKRVVVQTDLTDPSQILKDEYVNHKINRSLSEFKLASLLSVHPAGILSIGFQLTRLVKQNLIVTEYFMEDAGVSLARKISEIKTDVNKIFKVMMQVASAMCYIESIKVVYNDIKTANFLIDANFNLRMIDFDISHSGGFGHTTTFKGVTFILGKTPGFVPPESILLFNSIQGNNQQFSINPWKADIYSWGILVLCITGVVDQANLPSLDQLKNPVNHDRILEYADQINLGNYYNMTEKIRYIVKTCLNFNPNLRISFKKLFNLLEHINEYPIETIKNEISKEISTPHYSRSELLGFLENKTLENNKLIAEIQRILQENVRLKTENDFLRNEIDLSFKELQKFNSNIPNNTRLPININNTFQAFQNEKSDILVKIRNIVDNKNLNLKLHNFSDIPELVTKLASKISSEDDANSNMKVGEFNPQLYMTEEERIKNNYLYFVEDLEGNSPEILHVKYFSQNFNTKFYLYPSSLYANDASFHKSSIFYCGGHTGTEIDGEFLNYCIIVDLKARKIISSSSSPLTEQNANMSLVSTSEFLFGLGGYNRKLISTVEYFDDKNKQWKRIQPLNKADRCITSFFWAPSFIYTFGGNVNQDPERKNITDINANWEIIHLSTKSHPRFYGCSFFLNKNEVLIFGGRDCPTEFVIFNLNSSKLHVSSKAFINEAFFSSKPVFHNNLIYVKGQENSLYLINPRTLEYNLDQTNFELGLSTA